MFLAREHWLPLGGARRLSQKVGNVFWPTSKGLRGRPTREKGKASEETAVRMGKGAG